MKAKHKHTTRESWLLAAIEEFRPVLEQHGGKFGKPRVSVGWPKGSRKAIGQWWPAQLSKDGVDTIFISPELEDPETVLATLLHEVIHACTPGDGHGKAFGRLARAAGLEGKLTATYAGDDLKAELKALNKALGTFPHAALNDSKRKKQSTRMLKVECSGCGCVARMTRKWLEEVGPPTCGCGTEMEAA